ncbi:MAG TPA: DUF552 domain-containing protein [Candidatus Korarchaeota archaeon]|nr:MAG: hypothetical protein DRO05_02970 [Candidatus Korarchaeota archaeon]HDD69362.1 DUF552 domain-containing protein [Candidatus Korarchaeota archaeon]
MGFLSGIFRKRKEEEEEFLPPSEVEEEIPEKPIAIKPMMLSDEGDIETILKEVRDGNIVIVRYNNYASKEASRLTEIIQRLKESVMEEGGETVLIDTSEFPPLLVVPRFVEVWRSPHSKKGI